LGVGYLISGNCHGGGDVPASLYVELSDTRDWHIHWARFFRGNAQALLASHGKEMSSLAAVLRRVLAALPRR
jgi:hypothetical protein